VSRIAVVGAGAMGSVYAGLLAAAGHDVWAVDLWREHVEAIRRRGLRVSGASGERVVRLSATTHAADAGVCDLVVIATKAMDVEAAALSARPLVGPDAVVLTIQNGLGSADRVARVLEPVPVAVGVAGGFGASIRAPGHVHHNGWELIRVGERQGPVTPRLRAVADLFAGAGFRVKAYDDIGPMIWEKLICNVTYSGTCCLTGRTIGETIADPEAWRVASGCAAEAFAVAKARGIGVAIDDPVDYVRRFGLTIPDARPSMLLDHMARRRSEIDVINGAIPREAEAVGLVAPYNEVVSALVRERERRFGPEEQAR
jgi:2-dehydropantoate 2-reductase